MPPPVYGVSETIGWRESMEDAHEAGEHLGGKIFAAGVYDGHDGALAAQLAAKILTPLFLRLWLAESEKPPHERRPDAELVRLAYLAADEFIAASCGASGAAAASFYPRAFTFWATDSLPPTPGTPGSSPEPPPGPQL